MSATADNAIELLERVGYPNIFVRELPDGRIAWVVRFAFTFAILTAKPELIEHFYDDRWCFHSRQLAIDALKEWNPRAEAEPMGWHRHPDTGRRRPDGDPEKEYVNL